MSFRDQKKYLEDLKHYEFKIKGKDLDDYKMFVKMNKDEEEFDSVTMKRLKELYDKYHVTADRSKFDALFKKPEDK